MPLKRITRALTPPLLWRAGRKLKRATASPDAPSPPHWTYGAEQPPAFYDERFRNAKHWRRHYTASHYYPLWTVIADRLRRAGAVRVLDVGCGPGQVASLLRDQGLPAYVGLDFSPERVRRAREVCPEYAFHVADVFETDLLANEAYDGVLVMEFLEHVERDLDVLARIRPGALVLATVPNFPAAGHVRFFERAEDVRARYAPLLARLEVHVHLENAEGKTYFILEGVR